MSKTIKVEYTFKTVINVQVDDLDDPVWAAESRGQDEEFKLDGQVTWDFRILED